MPRSAKWILLGLAAFAAAAVVFASLAGRTVEVVQPMRRELVQSLVVTGRVLAPSRIEIGTLTSGNVVEVLVDEGDVVRRGQLLLRLDEAEERAAVEQARAAVEEAKARLERLRTVGLPQADAGLAQAAAEYEQARKQWERYRSLHAQGALSDSSLDEAQRRLEAAEAQRRRAAVEKQGLASGGAEMRVAAAAVANAEATLSLAEARLARTQLLAPADGVVLLRDVEPGEAVFITLDGQLHTRQCAKSPQLVPCSFEYVYLARPDSVMNGISVYEARLRMGERLADTIAKYTPREAIDVVMPIPDSARPAAMQVARKLGVEYREGFYKNRYVGRTFIMPGQAVRKKSVRQKLNAMSSEFKGKNVLLIDDSIVRGTTSREIIQMARDAGALSVTFASAAPPVRYPHVYGINMPSRHELVAHGRTIPEVAKELGCDYLVYQEVDDLKAAILEGSPDVEDLDMSCFDGRYVTGTVSEEYLSWLESSQES